jgi:hypothetical protein
MLQLDSMHILDHHGIISLTVGALMGTSIFARELGPTAQECLAALNQRIQTYYKQHKIAHRVGSVRMVNVFNGKRVTPAWPSMSTLVARPPGSGEASRPACQGAARLATQAPQRGNVRPTRLGRHRGLAFGQEGWSAKRGRTGRGRR